MTPLQQDDSSLRILMTLFLVLQSLPNLTQSPAFCLTVTCHLSGTSVYRWRTCFLLLRHLVSKVERRILQRDIVLNTTTGLKPRIIQCRFIYNLTLRRKSMTSFCSGTSSLTTVLYLVVVVRKSDGSYRMASLING